jgi:polyisoprenoid-binding protein YceI
VKDLGPGVGGRQLRAEVTLHGTTVPVEVAARVERGADEIEVTGTLPLDQSRFGIVPFSILGGAIAVQDRLTVRFRIRADRLRIQQCSRRRRP